MENDGSDEALGLFTAGSEAEDQNKLAEAIRYYQAAAKLQFTGAMINLANIYDDKLHHKDPIKAVALYKKAFNLGDIEGAYCLAIHHRNAGNKRWHDYWMRKYVINGGCDVDDWQ